MSKLVQPPPSKLGALRLGIAVTDAVDPKLMSQAAKVAADVGAHSAEILTAEIAAIGDETRRIAESSGEVEPLLAPLAVCVRELEGLAGSYGFTLVAETLQVLRGYLLGQGVTRGRLVDIASLHLDAAANLVHHDIRGAGGRVERDVLDGLRALVATTKAKGSGGSE